MMARDDVVMTKKIENFKIALNCPKPLNMIFKCILHHLAKFQINWPSFTVILGNFQKLEQDENFLVKMRTVRTTFKMAILRVKIVC